VDAVVSGSIGVVPMQRAEVNAKRGATVFGSVVTGILGQPGPTPAEGPEELDVTVRSHDGSTGELLRTHEDKVKYWDSTDVPPLLSSRKV
jgi:hypothetical protein